jgi:hypothetical protein
MSSTAKAKLALEPLDIKCTSSDCGHNLHCFIATTKMVSRNQKGACRSCGETLVDWARVHRKDPGDAANTFRMLKLEMIRHHFWHKEIDEKAVKHARRKGKAGIRAAIENRLRNSLRAENPWDGRQTPKEGNSIFYAQHATATCCRKCLEEWHDIPLDRELSEEEVAYLTELCVMFIGERLPDLTEAGEKIPPDRKPKSARAPEETPGP